MSTPTFVPTSERIDEATETSSAIDARRADEERRAEAWAWAFVGAGICVRVWRYLRRYPVWLDEHLLTLNLLDRDYAGLTRGLDHEQAAPLGFLWCTKWLVATFGLNEFTLRGVALVSSVVGLVAFRWLAGRVLHGLSLAAAVGLAAVSYFPIRHSAEFKPYAGDLLFAVLLLHAALAWLEAPKLNGRWVRLLLVSLAALPFSYPAIFTAAGIAGAAAVAFLQSRRIAVAAAGGLYAVVVAAAFGLLFHWSTADQFSVATRTQHLYDYWRDGFPPAGFDVLGWLRWLTAAHAGEAFALPIGTKNYGSIVSAAVALVGAVALWRSGRRALPTIVAGILVAALAAAVLRKYPYGHGERLHQYWVPWVAVFLGSGIGVWVDRVRSPTRRRRVVAVLVGLLAVGFLASVGESILAPYKHRWDRAHQSFSRWFWNDAAAGEPLVCIADDLGYPLYPETHQSPYRINREIYRPHVPYARAADHFRSIAPGATIRCVAFAQTDDLRDERAFAAWRDAMRTAYRLVDERTYDVMIDDKPGKAVTYFVWRFEPLGADRRLSEVLHR